MESILLTVIVTAAATAFAMGLYVILAGRAERHRRHRRTELAMRRRKEDERLREVYSRGLTTSGAR